VDDEEIILDVGGKLLSHLGYDVLFASNGREAVEVYERNRDSVDVVIALRLQRERQKSGLLPSLREYRELFMITRERLSAAKEDVLVMHPGPINRGIELAPDVADGMESAILEQVTNGVAVRMAILYLLIGGR